MTVRTPRFTLVTIAATLVLALGAAPVAHAQAGSSALPAEYQRLAREVITEAVNTNTTRSVGSTTALANKIVKRLVAAGYPRADIVLAGPDPKNQNLVVRLRARAGAQHKPLLLMAHLDVVEANAADWPMDPFTLREKDGFFFGRGSEDDKSGVTVLVTNLIRWKREHWVPDRDIIAYFSSDEESDATIGIDWIIKHRRDLIDAEYSLNTDGGGVSLEGGEFRSFDLEASEKIYVSYRLETTNSGGHSSRPRPDNAIYQLAGALTRLAAYQFPVALNEITRAELEREAPRAAPAVAADMLLLAREGGATSAESQAAAARLSTDPEKNSLLRTTCVATMLEGGHAENALPQRARATVNCRMLPTDDAAAVKAALQRVVGDSVTVSTVYDAVPSAPSPLRADVMATVERLAAKYFPGAIVIPTMALGASDGLYLRNAGIPSYSVSAVAEEGSESNAHGRDEKVRVRSIFDATAFWYDLVRALGSDLRP